MISFKSKITRELLNYFFINPHQSLYVNELSRKLDLDKRNLVKKIKESIGKKDLVFRVTNFVKNLTSRK